jgi:methyltransferase (TIGR00027 family)
VESVSETAVFAAQVRAAHALLDPDPIADDPYALILAAATENDVRELFDAIPSAAARVARILPSQRARFVDQEVEQAILRGVNQYVIMGAGLDSFAWRRGDLMAEIEVFEIDRPATQDWKRARLKDAQLGVPPGLHFVSMDFTAPENLHDRLADVGFDPDRPSIWSWLGVIVYLPIEAVRRTMTAVLDLAAPRSRLIATYTVTRDLMDADSREFDDLAREASKATGEPHVTFLAPEEMETIARQAGWPTANSLNPLSFAPWFAHRSDGLVPARYEWLLVADA